MNNEVRVVTPTYRFLIALLLSLLIHSAMLLDIGPTSHGHRDILQVRLTAPVQRAPDLPELPPVESAAPALSPQNTLAPAGTNTAPSATAPSVAAVPEELATVSADSTKLPPKPPVFNTEPGKQPVLRLPDRAGPTGWAEISFDIFAGENREPLGKGLQHYESDASGLYQLSFSGTDKPQQQSPDNHWQISIEGLVTENGLKPSSYQLQGVLAEHLMAMNTSNNAALSPGSPRQGFIADGTLDRLSMLYQFMFLAMVDADGQLVLTDGNRAIAYTYHIVESEPLEIPLQGLIRTLRLTLSANESRETTILWLAPHFGYLPIKLRLTDSNGAVTELVATSVTIR